MANKLSPSRKSTLRSGKPPQKSVKMTGGGKGAKPKKNTSGKAPRTRSRRTEDGY